MIMRYLFIILPNSEFDYIFCVKAIVGELGGRDDITHITRIPKIYSAYISDKGGGLGINRAGNSNSPKTLIMSDIVFQGTHLH